MRRASDPVVLWTLPFVIVVCGLLVALVITAVVRGC